MIMKRHNNWRIIAVIVILLFIGFILNGLLTNTEKKMSEICLADLSNMLVKGIASYYPNQLEETREDEYNKIWETIRNHNPEFKVFGVVDGRRFAYHSDEELIGTKIDKDLFDTQRELKKGIKNETSDYVVWRQSETEQSRYRIYYPLLIDGKVKGMAFLEADNTNSFAFGLKSSSVYFVLVLCCLVILLIDRFIKRFAFLPAVIIFVLTISLTLNIVYGNYQKSLTQWNELKTETQHNLESELNDNGVGIYFSLDDLETAIPSTIDIWKYTLSLLGLLLLIFALSGAMERFISTLIEYRLAYAYILPAMFGVFLLVFFPFVYGFLIGFTDYNLTNFGGDLIEYFTDLGNYNVGNFINILKVVNFRDYSNFYFTLAHTIVWTVLNLVFHVSIGIGLALLLNDPKLKGRTAFRILLILPWAIPNYITALIWRGMFHKQFGAINGLLELLGFEPLSWFTQPVTAFLANFATNVWLGFPFMMIIALGALQSIPKELYEASAIDGSSKWQSFWNVTMPLLRPAMVPAIILGTIWTFNQFNVIYLVSGGGPAGATELLITDAYKLAFEQYRYGYAAAYCIVIFVLLLTYGIITSRVTKATKGVYE